MFVVHFNINGENTNYYFNSIRNAKKFERKILLHVYDDIEKMKQNYIETYIFT